jgi:ubiquinone/menaquinone biosynthesis C-methylase UbiE
MASVASMASASKGLGSPSADGKKTIVALGAVQQAFGAAEKGYDKIFDAMTTTPEFETEFGDLLCKMPPMKKKLLSIRTLLPVAREKVRDEARATSEKRKGILAGYRGKAAGKGIRWKESKESLESRGLETWEREREACTNPTLAYPSYWELGGKGTLHSYDAGNCCWEAAFDLPVGAYELVHAHHFPDVPAQECFSKLHGALDNATIDALAGNSATLALDVGCGAGTSTFSLRETLNARGLEKCDLVGLDLSAYFIAVAQYRLRAGDKHDIPGSLSFIHGNALNVGYKDGSVDIFMASAVTHELPKHASEELIAEAARALRPGGVFGYFDLNPVQILRDNPVSNIVDRVAISNEPFLDDFLEFDLEECLAKNGLQVVNIRATNEAKWPDWQECPCRIVIAKKMQHRL